MPAAKDLTGVRFGRLTVLSDRGERSAGSILWNCHCDCGAEKIISAPMLKTGKTRSCGCLHREWASTLGKSTKQPFNKCSVDDCARKVHAHGFCEKHSRRVKDYGAPDRLMPKEVRSSIHRQTKITAVTGTRPTSPRKLFGRKEHRVIAEEMAGRPLTRKDVVIFKDGDNRNSDPDNLWLESRADLSRRTRPC